MLRLQPFVLWFLGIAMLFMSSCAGVHKRIVYKAGKDWVAVRQAMSEDLKTGPFNHPKVFTDIELRDILATIQYSHTMFISVVWSKPLQVFSDSQQAILAGSFREAFAEMGPKDELEFSIRDEKKESHETRGRAFIVGDNLNLVFECIDHPTSMERDELNILGKRDWKLLPAEGQRLLAIRSDDKGKLGNWLIVPVGQGGYGSEPIKQGGQDENRQVK